VAARLVRSSKGAQVRKEVQQNVQEPVAALVVHQVEVAAVADVGLAAARPAAETVGPWGIQIQCSMPE